MKRKYAQFYCTVLDFVILIMIKAHKVSSSSCSETFVTCSWYTGNQELSPVSFNFLTEIYLTTALCDMTCA